MVKTSAAGLFALAFAACGYHASFEDCRVACSATSGCPSDLTCATSEGWCRTGETTALCSAIGVDAGPCLTYFDDATAFATLTLTVEDFARRFDGSPTPNAFASEGGDYFYWHDRVTFATRGVNAVPGGQTNTIVVGGAAAPAPTTIMSQISSSTAHDAIAASFTTNVAAVAFRPSDDEGMQSYMLDVVTTNGSLRFSVASAHAPFVGVVSSCGNVIASATLSPPMPSNWWRLFSVTFGP